MTTGLQNEIRISQDDRIIFEGAREGLSALKKTFDHWVLVGRGIQRARQIADDKGGRWTFQSLLRQERLDELVGDKATTSRLEKIMANLSAVVSWRETLTGHQKLQWSSPSSVVQKCPVFHKTKTKTENAATASPMAKVKDERDELKRQLAHAEDQLAAAEARDGSQFDLKKDSAENIAKVIVESITASKAEKIARAILSAVKPKARKAEVAVSESKLIESSMTDAPRLSMPDRLEPKPAPKARKPGAKKAGKKDEYRGWGNNIGSALGMALDKMAKDMAKDED